MHSGAIARLLLGDTEAEKTAFIKRIATAPLRSAGNFVGRAAKNAPGTTFLTAATTAALGPTLLREAVTPSQASRVAKHKRSLLAHQASQGKYAMANKYAAAGISDADARQALAIRSGLEKRAGKIPNTALASLGGVRNMFLAGLALGAGAQVSGIAGAGVAGTVGKASEMKMNASSGKRYSAMLKADPSLRSAPKARTYFNVLQKASPFIASEPHVAAATIRSMLESPEGYALHPKVLKDIMEIEGKRQDTRYPGLRVPTFRGELPDMT